MVLVRTRVVQSAMLLCAKMATGALEIYDEAVSAEYIWINQITGMDEDAILNWNCGLACDTVKSVNNRRLTQHGWPLETMGVVAEYGAGECLLAFRGSKTLLNFLLDDSFFAWTSPYPLCPDCKVHEGFYMSWHSLRAQTYAELGLLGCDKKPIRITGHSLGAAMSAIAAFDLADNYTVKHVYTYGQPRVANQAWVSAFETKMTAAQVSYFRVVDFMDAVVHLPPKGFVHDSKQSSLYNVLTVADQDSAFHQVAGGYVHAGPEVYYHATKLGAYKICPTGEDPSCSDQFSLAECLFHTCCHCSYLGMNPCDGNDPNPQCVQPAGIVAIDSLLRWWVV